MDSGISIQIYEGAISQDVSRDIIEFRKTIFDADTWGAEDDYSIHVTAQMAGMVVGYYRLLDWSSYTHSEDILQISPLAKVFSYSPDAFQDFATFEVGRFCIHPKARSRFVPRLLWRSLSDVMKANLRPVIAVGMVTIEDQSMDQAAEFELARLNRPCGFTQDFKPHYDLPVPDPVDPEQKLRSRIVKSYDQIGGRFGSSAIMPPEFPHFGGQPCVICTIRSDEVRI